MFYWDSLVKILILNIIVIKSIPPYVFAEFMCVFVHVCVTVYACLYTCVCVCVLVCIHVWVCGVCVCVCLCVCVCIHVWVCGVCVCLCYVCICSHAALLSLQKLWSVATVL